MATIIKTTIAIQKSTFEEAESFAQQLNMSCNHLFELAIVTFVRNHQNQMLLGEINKAYSDEQDAIENANLSKIRKSYRKLVECEKKAFICVLNPVILSTGKAKWGIITIQEQATSNTGESWRCPTFMHLARIDHRRIGKA